MGERGNIMVREAWGDPYDAGEGVFLYTHWTGYLTHKTAQAALDRARDRWDDSSYLARNLFREMIRGYEEDTTGFGISCHLTDHNYPTVVVDCKAQTIGLAEPGSEPQTFVSWSFEEFVSLEMPEDIDALRSVRA